MTNNDQILLQVFQSHLREGRIPKAQLLVGAWLQRSPGSATAIALQAQLDLASGQLEQAQQHAQQANAIDSHNAQSAFALGQTYAAQNQLDQAITALERAHLLAPGDPSIASHLAQVHTGRRQVEQALKVLDNFKTNDPSHYDPLLLKAELLLNHRPDQPERVLDITQRICAVAPHLATARILNGLALASVGDSEGARQQLELGMQIEPDQVPFLLAAVQFTLQDPASTPAHLEQATAHAQRACALAPQDWRGPLNLGRLMRRQRQINAAVQMLGQACKNFAQEAELWLELGQCSLHAGQHSAAENALAKAQEINPQHPLCAELQLALHLRQDQWASANAAHEAQDQALYAQRPRLPAPVAASAKVQVIGLYGRSLGDYLQYARYLGPLKRASGARLRLACTPGMAPLFGLVDGVDEVMDNEKFGAQWVEPLVRTPLLLGLQDQPPVWQGAYLRATPATRAHAQAQRSAHAGPCVLLDLGDQPEAILLRQLGYWLAQNKALVLLVSGQAAWRAGTAGATLLPLPTQDLDLLAAWATVADAVLTLGDTPLAHLSGALALQAQVLLPLGHDPMWGGKANSTWYPTLQLHREPLAGGWEQTWGAIEKILPASRTPDPAQATSPESADATKEFA